MNNKEMLDEMREKITKVMHSCINKMWAMDEKVADSDEAVDKWYGEFGQQILSLETDTCRIAVVSKKGRLPRNVYATSVPAEFQTKEGFDLWVAYGEAQQDMLNAGYVKEVTNG